MGFVAKESHAHSVGLWAVQRSRYLERSLLFCRKMQRPTLFINSSRTVQHWRKVLGPPTGTPRYVHGQGASLWQGPCTTDITSTTRPPPRPSSCQLTTDAVPLVLSSKKDKGCTISSFATTNKIWFLLERWEALLLLRVIFVLMAFFLCFPFCTDIILGMLPFLHGWGGGKGRRKVWCWGEVLEMRIKSMDLL